jgi:tetratricopeptide (TPR) repeat protein
MKFTSSMFLFSTTIAWLLSSQLAAQETSELSHVQQRWAEVNYQLDGKSQLSAFVQLVEEVEMLSANEPNSAEVWIWSGIVKSTYAGAKGGLGALGMAKQAKADLEQAMEIDADALDGSSYTSLGTLYHSVPRWPVGFGNNGKAEELLLKAITLNPNGIDTNYFYGTYLLDEKRYDEAEQYLLQAQQAPARPNRPVADSGRQREIGEALELLNKKR